MTGTAHEPASPEDTAAGATDDRSTATTVEVHAPPRESWRTRLTRPMPLHPILFALYTVLFAWSGNIRHVTIGDAAPLLAVVGAGAFAVLLMLVLPLRGWLRAGLVATAVVVAVLTYGHVDRMLAPLRVSRTIQLAGWLAVIVVTLVFALKARPGLVARATSGLNVLAAVLLTLALVSIVPVEIRRIERGAPHVATPQAGASAAAGRDIYFLVFDRYGSNSSLRGNYGVENDLPDWLRSRGFDVADGARANYARTPLSLAATLNMTFLDEITARYGRDTGDLVPTYQMIRDQAVGRFLRSQGYTYVNIGSWWAPTFRSPIADVNVNGLSVSEFPATYFQGTMLSTLPGRLAEGKPVANRHVEGALSQFEHLRSMPAVPGPKFVFAHVLLPHPPYVFHADGRVLTSRERAAMREPQLFDEQLRFTNDRIREVVDTLLSGPEETRPIIVIQADEGPWVLNRAQRTKTEWYQIRYGILSAMYLPGVAPADVHAPVTPVNTFRTLFSRYFGADLPPLPDRSFGWPTNDRAYSFVDVTHLWDAPAPGRPPPSPAAPTASPPTPPESGAGTRARATE